MKTIYLTDTTRLKPGYMATIGFFDGVHRGHRFLIDTLRRQATERGLRSMVVTFDRHPRQVLHSDWQPNLLSSLGEKERLLGATGIDVLVVLHFTVDMAVLTAEQFMRQVLYNQLGVRCLLTGYDNRFGHNRNETFDDYQRYGREMGMDVVCGEPLSVGDCRVSSSAVRQLLWEGRVADACRCLGRPYELVGTVVHGEQIGRRLGYPTANLRLAERFQLVPRVGVYGVKVQVGDDGRWWSGMTNVGLRPTFNGHEVRIETHLFDFTGDIYGRTIRVAFHCRVRDERPFHSSEELRRQMAEDEKVVRESLTPNPSRWGEGSI